MKVILGCDPLLQPLTGIGNYTQKLAEGYLKKSEIEDLQLFAHGRFFNHELVEKCILDKVADDSKQHPVSFFSKVRGELARSEIAVKIYSVVFPYINGARLSQHKNYLYHSPNFVLPNFEGKKIVTIHDLSTIKFPSCHPKARVKYVNQQIEKSIKYADHIITDSQFIKNEIVDMFALPEDKISAIHLGASSLFKVRSEKECSVIEKYDLKYNSFFLFVSTIEPRKNIVNLLKAFAMYRKDEPNGIPLILVGNKGWNDESIQDLINTLSNKGWIQHLGYVPQIDIPFLYSSAKGLLFPSLYEGFGLPVLEAMQSGLPVLTCTNSSMSEITQNNAVLVEPEDIAGMSQQIKRLSVDHEWALNLNANGVIRAKDFSWNKCIKETLNVYQALI